ncbi:sigma factor [Streptosporangium sp. CA-135522]|uniref:sigma factor n=1 Tax=Streptosporangium sp. CA-135522 TaxID=3240072 RepID=UPI003D8EC5B2
MSAKTSQGDAELLTETRLGNATAYGVLYERHAFAARVLAHRLVRSPAEAEEVLAKTFTGILDLVRRGGGPREAFRPYLLTALRRTVHDRACGESGRAFEPGAPFADPALNGLERSPVARAFLSLPERWQLVLWHTAVERSRAAEVALLLGVTANGVAALAYMAREGWREAYLRAHLAGAPRQGCRPMLRRMVAYVRGALARRESRDLDEHMDGCDDCHEVFLELADVNQGLRVIVGPLVAGTALAGYLAALDRASAADARGPLGWWRRAPMSHRRAVAGGAAAGAAALAATLVLVSAQGLRAAPAASVPAPAPIAAAPAPASGPEGLPSPSGRPGKAKSGRPGKAKRPSPSRPGAAASPPGREAGPVGGRTDAGGGGTGPAPRLVAGIDALGALVRSEAGIVAVRLRNAGRRESGELVADVGLPDGVTVLAAARRGRAVAVVKPVGTVDGWTCRAGASGARCLRGPLPAGRITAIFLRVVVSPSAAEGSAPSVRVSSAGVAVTARSRTGVRAVGAPARFAADGRVVTAAVGNTLLDCAPADSACKAARTGKNGRRDNDMWEMSPADRDRDPSTRSSSAARLDLPETSKLVWAGLYWSASAPADGRIRFKAPGQARYAPVRAERVTERRLPAGAGYQAFADVTRLMGELRGTYWAADASLAPGVSRHAGWSLVVIAADSGQPYGRAVVVDTATVVDRRHGPARIPLDGLAPAAAPARVDLITWEGDAGVRGDRVTLGGRPLRPDGGDRDAGNPFDGSATGALETGTTFGTDVDRFRAPLGRDPVLSVSTDRDVLFFGAAVVRVQRPE